MSRRRPPQPHLITCAPRPALASSRRLSSAPRRKCGAGCLVRCAGAISAPPAVPRKYGAGCFARGTGAISAPPAVPPRTAHFRPAQRPRLVLSPFALWATHTLPALMRASLRLQHRRALLSDRRPLSSLWRPPHRLHQQYPLHWALPSWCLSASCPWTTRFPAPSTLQLPRPPAPAPPLPWLALTPPPPVPRAGRPRLPPLWALPSRRFSNLRTAPLRRFLLHFSARTTPFASAWTPSSSLSGPPPPLPQRLFFASLPTAQLASCARRPQSRPRLSRRPLPASRTPLRHLTPRQKLARMFSTLAASHAKRCASR